MRVFRSINKIDKGVKRMRKIIAILISSLMLTSVFASVANAKSWEDTSYKLNSNHYLYGETSTWRAYTGPTVDVAESRAKSRDKYGRSKRITYIRAEIRTQTWSGFGWLNDGNWEERHKSNGATIWESTSTPYWFNSRAIGVQIFRIGSSKVRMTEYVDNGTTF